MPVNSFLVDTGPGIVVVDAQLCVDDAAAVRDAVRATGKPLLAVVVTHPHPDHYAGAAVIAPDPGVPIFATREVAEVVSRDDAEKNDVVGPMMGDQWPRSRRFPDHLVADGEVLELGDLGLTVRSWGPGESHADTVWSSGESWFVGDLVYHDHHAYLADGHGTAWLDSLERLEQEIPPTATLYVGHGEPGGPELLPAQRRYVETFLEAVDAARALEPDAREARVLDAVRPLVSREDLMFLARLSVEPAAANAPHR